MNEPQGKNMVSMRSTDGMIATIFIGGVSLFVVLASLFVYCITELFTLNVK